MTEMPAVTLPGDVVGWIVEALQRRQAIEEVRGLGAGSAPAQSIADMVQMELERAGVMSTAAGRLA